MVEQNTLNVCFLINHLDSGGAQTLLRNIIERDNDPAVNYTVCYAGGNDEMVGDLESVGAEVVHLGAKTQTPQFSPIPLVNTFRYFGQQDFDVIHTHLPYAAVLGRIAARRANASVITTHHSVQQNYHPLERRLEAATRAYDDAAVFVSNAVAESFAEQFPRTLPTTTIYNGIDAEEFSKRLTAADGDFTRESLGVDDGTLVLNVGHSIKEKRQVDLITAVAAIAQDDDVSQEVHLAIVGEGPQLPRLRALVQEQELDEYVSLVGRVPPAEIFRYYAAADVYAQVSVYEGMPMTILEAMAAGLPLIGTSVPGIEEFVDPGETGLLVPPTSPQELKTAVLELTDTQHREKMGEKSRQYVAQRYDIAQTVSAYKSLYETLGESNGEEVSSLATGAHSQ